MDDGWFERYSVVHFGLSDRRNWGRIIRIIDPNDLRRVKQLSIGPKSALVRSHGSHLIVSRWGFNDEEHCSHLRFTTEFIEPRPVVLGWGYPVFKPG
jgi:hypothetical protein